MATFFAALVLWDDGELSAQGQPIHYFHRADLPPGTVGQGQLLRGGPLRGYFQPVEIQVPPGTLVSLAVDGHFQPPAAGSTKAGMLIGEVYRIKVGNVPGHPGVEVFPTIEVINRLYPPPGQSMRYPIPVQLTPEELELAAHGAYVTRVIYLEDPDRAFPEMQEEHQRYFDVGDRVDPLQVADELGRPMAILRMGSRIPTPDPITGRFAFATPPLMLWADISQGEPIMHGVPGPPAAPEPQLNQVDPTPSRRTVLEAFRGNVPRVPLPPGVFTSGEGRPTTRR